MKKVRLTANILFYVTRLISILYITTVTYALLVILLALNGTNEWLPMRIAEDGSFQIFYPFTHTPFLLGDNTGSFKLIMLLITWGYGLFFLLLSGVFNAFRQTKIFVQKGVARLSRFYIANLTIPVSILIIFAFAGIAIKDMLIITALHLVIAVFAFFMAAIFKQGLLLQEEQDLTF
jgi:hypothetical protein